MNSQITLRIHSLKCLDETGGSFAERVGNDEMALAGFGIDANANTVQVPRFRVFSHFDDGDIQAYSPPKEFVTLTLANNGSFPKTCSVGFLLAEEDGGNFGTKANEIYAKVKEEMGKQKKAKEQEVVARRRLVMSDGSSNIAETDSPEAEPLLSAETLKLIWIVVKPILYGWIRDRIVSAINDDLFPPRDVTVTISSADFTWNGSKTSPPTALEFRGHNGIYLLTYDWMLS